MVGIGKEAVEFSLVLYVQEDEGDAADTGGETADIDEAADLVAGHVAPGDLEIALFHVGWLWGFLWGRHQKYGQLGNGVIYNWLAGFVSLIWSDLLQGVCGYGQADDKVL